MKLRGKETVELAGRKGEHGILEIALNAAGRVRTDCPLEAEKGWAQGLSLR